MITKQIFATSNSWNPFFIRIALGIVIFAHGGQKAAGWFGGYGFGPTMRYFTETMGLPWIIAITIIGLETAGAIMLLAGLATRIIATGYLVLALGIIFTSHLQFGFFMNWFGNQDGEGYEYFILWIGMALALIASGGGRMSLDRQILPF